MKRIRLVFSLLLLVITADTFGNGGTGPGSASDLSPGEKILQSPGIQFTDIRAITPEDKKRADAILRKIRKFLSPYKDCRFALRDGFKPGGSPTSSGEVHFNNSMNAKMEKVGFDPAKPTSLLYKLLPDGSYELVGVMYLAPWELTQDQLNERVPLSIVRWHAHKNRCFPPQEHARSGPGPAFTHDEMQRYREIVTEKECAAAGGVFKPMPLYWMLHVYPFEKNPGNIWRRGM